MKHLYKMKHAKMRVLIFYHLKEANVTMLLKLLVKMSQESITIFLMIIIK